MIVSKYPSSSFYTQKMDKIDCGTKMIVTYFKLRTSTLCSNLISYDSLDESNATFKPFYNISDNRQLEFFRLAEILLEV